MANNAYLFLRIDGADVDTQSIEVNGFVHGVSSPRDAASGLPTGKRQHKPFVFTKAVDSASALLMDALIRGSVMESVELQMWRATPGSREEHYYTVTLSNASVSDIRTEMLNNQYPENQQHEIREHVSLCYQRISWTHADRSTASDQWESRG